MCFSGLTLSNYVVPEWKQYFIAPSLFSLQTLVFLLSFIIKPCFIFHRTCTHYFIAWDQALQWGKEAKKIGKESELIRSLGRRKGPLSPFLVHHLTSCFTSFLPLSLTMISGLRQYFNSNDLQLVKGTFNYK